MNKTEMDKAKRVAADRLRKEQHDDLKAAGVDEKIAKTISEETYARALAEPVVVVKPPPPTPEELFEKANHRPVKYFKGGNCDILAGSLENLEVDQSEFLEELSRYGTSSTFMFQKLRDLCITCGYGAFGKLIAALGKGTSLEINMANRFKEGQCFKLVYGNTEDMAPDAFFVFKKPDDYRRR